LAHQLEHFVLTGRQPRVPRPVWASPVWVIRIHRAAGRRPRNVHGEPVRARRSGRRDLPDRPDEFVPADTLVQEGIDVQQQHLLNQPKIVVRGQHDDPRTRAALADLGHRAARRPVRHLQIEQDDVGLGAGRDCDRRATGPGVAGDPEIGLGSEQVADGVTEQRVIVRDQDLDHAAAPLSGT
jgi:hypothetical protein